MLRRHSDAPPRADWQKLVSESGVVYDYTELPGGEPFHYWREGSYLSLSSDDVACLDNAARTVFELCDEAGDYLSENPQEMSKMGIPAAAQDAVRNTWWRKSATGQWFGSVYGRFDVAFGGLDHPDPRYRVPKFYEFNADTPTTLVESSLAQWDWFTATKRGYDQWNRIFEDLIDAWRRNVELIYQTIGSRPPIYFSCSDQDGSGEDAMNVIHLQDACQAAGFVTRRIAMEEIGLGSDGRFYDNTARYESSPVPLQVVFKLYPWEHMLTEEFGLAALTDLASSCHRDGSYSGGTIWIEPPYKMLWSNKALFAVLWRMFGDDERGAFLLPTYYEAERPESMEDYVRKPLLGREGGNLELVRNNMPIELKGGEYTDSGFVVQALHPLPALADQNTEQIFHPMCGVWMIDGEPAGLGVRESSGLITDNTSFFLPHVIR